jgi:hypothetical protein
MKRLIHGGGEARHRALAALLRRLPAPGGLDTYAVARIARSFGEPRRRRVPLLAAALAVGCLVAIAWRAWPVPEQGAPVVIAPGVSAGRVFLPLLRPVLSRAGRLALRTSDFPVVIDAPRGRARMAVASFVFHSLDWRVAAYAGRAAVESREATLAQPRAPHPPPAVLAPPRPQSVAAPQKVAPLPVVAPPPAVAPPPIVAPPPVVAPPPLVAAPPPAVALPPVAAIEPELRVESGLVADALARLRSGDARGALLRIDAYRARFPSGVLRGESDRIRVKALLASGRRSDALALLEGVALERDLAVLRGELRAQAGRCREAVDDFARVEGDDSFAERAWFGRAQCLARLGDRAGARQALERQLARFPSGTYATQARRMLRR